MIAVKLCPKCEITKPLSEFSKDKKSKDGHNFYCKTCCNAVAKEYRDGPRGIYQNIKGRVNYLNKNRPDRFKPLGFTRDEFIEWYVNEPKICAYCDILEDDLWILREHFDNRVFRLTVDCKDNKLGYTPNNVVLACERCNFIKGNLFGFDSMRRLAQEHIKPIWVEIKHRTKTGEKEK